MNYLGLEIFFPSLFCNFILTKKTLFCIFKALKFIINSNFIHYEKFIIVFDACSYVERV